MLAFLLALTLHCPARADEPAEEPAEEPAASSNDGWLDLSVPVDFGSALDSALETTLPATAEADLAEATLVTEPPSDPPQLLRGRFGLRPYLGLTGLDGTWGGAAGLTVSHQWWPLRERVLRPAGQSELRGCLPFGPVSGWDLRLDSTHGAWLGPVGLLLGPSLRAGALRAEAASAPVALTLGPQARLAVRAGPLTPWAALTPAWLLAGERGDLLDAPWDELTTTAGLALDGKPLGLRLSGEWRRVSVTHPADPPGLSTLWQANLGLHLRLL